MNYNAEKNIVVVQTTFIVQQSMIYSKSLSTEMISNFKARISLNDCYICDTYMEDEVKTSSTNWFT